MLGCVSPRWVITRVRNGTFPARKIVRDIRFTEADVQAILDVCRFKPTVAEIEDFTFVPELSARSKRSA